MSEPWMHHETEEERLERWASFAAGTLLMRWYLDYPLVDMTVSAQRVTWTELDGIDEQMPTLHKVLIRCAGVAATCSWGFLALEAQQGEIAEEFRQWVTPDFYLEYLDAMNTTQRHLGLAAAEAGWPPSTFPAVHSRQQVLDFYLAEANAVLDDHREVVEALTEIFCAQHTLTAEEGTRWLDAWAIRSRKAAYDGRFQVHEREVE